VLFGRLTARTRQARRKEPIMRTQRRLSDSEREERRERDRQRLKQATEQDAELAEYVRELEERSGDAGLQPLSGDEIAQEFEKYLRRRGGSTGPTAGGPW